MPLPFSMPFSSKMEPETNRRVPLTVSASTGCATLGNARGVAGALTSKSRTLFDTSAVAARPPPAATSWWKRLPVDESERARKARQAGAREDDQRVAGERRVEALGVGLRDGDPLQRRRVVRRHPAPVDGVNDVAVNDEPLGDPAQPPHARLRERAGREEEEEEDETTH